MLPATEANRGSSMPLITGADPDQSGLHGLVTRFVGAMSGPDPLMTAFEAISNDLTVRYGLEILLSNSNDDEDKKSLLLASKFEYSELQALVDDLFSSLQAREASVLLLSDFLARIWLSTLLLPSQLRAQGIKNVSIYPFATTPTSNVFEGAMLDGTPVAMKTFRRSQVRPATEEDVKRFFFEAMILFTTDHLHIMPFLGMHVSSGNVYLASKFQKNGTLPSFLNQNPKADRLFLLESVAQAVVYMHSLASPILHGDIRGMNVLVDDAGNALLIDMGLSMVMDPGTLTFLPASHSFSGNPRWTPLEKICPSEFPLTLKSDSFSFASFMLEVLSGGVPYRHVKSDSAVIVEVVVRRKLPTRPDHPQLTDTLWDLMMKCWSIDPQLRPSMDAIYRTLVSVRSESETGVL